MEEIPDHYQVEVRKESSLKSTLSQTIIYNISGTQNRININSQDSSLNVVDITPEVLFERLTEAINKEVSDEDKKIELIDLIEGMKETRGTDKFIEKYSKFFEANDDITKTVESDEIENKQCAVCGKKLDLDKFYKSDDSPDGLTTICKECSRKSHAAKAIEEIRNYIDPSTPFNKEDLLKQSNNRMVFLDYFWTLQEFNLLEEDKKPDYYHLTDEKELNEFIEKYGLKTPEKTPPKVEEAPKKKKTPKLAKTCEICNLKLPISDFFKTHDSEDGYSAKCKKCSRKSYAARALNALLDCVEPDVLFYKKEG